MIYQSNGKPIAHFAELLNLGDAVVEEIVNPETNEKVLALVTWGRNITQEFIDKVDLNQVDFVKDDDSGFYEKVISITI